MVNSDFERGGDEYVKMLKLKEVMCSWELSSNFNLKIKRLK
jgi:hypothetical protein